MPPVRACAWSAIALGLLGACPAAPVPAGLDAAPPPDATPPPFVPPLGATWDPAGDAVHFRLAAPRATRVEAWIYAAPLGAPEVLRIELARDDAGAWAARVAAADLAAAGVDTVYYGYRVWGPSWTWDAGWQPGSEAGFVARVTADGDRMNPNKLLIDPYARELSHDPTTPGSLDARVYRTDEAWRAVDSAPAAPKGIVLPADTWAGDLGPRPTRPLGDDVIYEVHLRGLTAGDATAPCRGTYAAAAARAGYLADLGVTAIELLPVQETWNDGNDVDPTSAAGDNYWGYSTLAFFAPDRRYACDRSPGGPTREWRAMVRAFHARGIKVLVDVVYNHTAEGGGGSLLSWRGIDNATYYQLDAAGTGFQDNTGIGANTNARSAVFQDLVMDSLGYWAHDLGVDGFRFDLASVLGNGCARGCYRWEPQAPGSVLVRAPAELPARPAAGGPGVDLIAEPWGIGGGTYRVGEFPAGWAEWNDRFRDLVRQDVNLLGVVDVPLRALTTRLRGSPDLFAAGGRPPAASINYVVSHDGFTLRDLHACTHKHNDQPWPYGPSSGGTDANYAWDHGGDPARQRQAARTSLALLLLAAGVPMITGGDEMLRSQRCNNNPYNVDSPAMWLDWAGLAEQAAFVTFTRRLLAFRHAHRALRPAGWAEGAAIVWRTPDGAAAPAAYLDDPGAHALAWRIPGAPGDPARSIYVAYNGGAGAAAFTLPAPAVGAAWWRVADTAAWMEPQGNAHAPGAEYRMNGARYDVAARALALFVER
jgi:isoamylase